MEPQLWRRWGGRRAQLIIATLALGAGAAHAAPAGAYPQGSLACFATALHVELAQDPVVANPTAVPCVDDERSQEVAHAESASGVGKATEASASTSGVLHNTPIDGDHGTAESRDAGVTLVAGAGAYVVQAEGLHSRATVTCSGGSPVLGGTTSVDSVRLNGRELDASARQQEIQLAPETYLRINYEYRPAPNVVYQFPVWLETPRGHLVAAESAAGYVDQPCTDGPPPPPPPPIPPSFGCIGSALQYNQSFPFLADPRGRCSATDASATRAALASSTVGAAALHARTWTTPEEGLPETSPFPEGTAAHAEAGAARLVLGSGVTADSAAAKASSTCSGGGVVLSSESRVHGLRIGGASLPDSTMPLERPLGGGAVLRVNWLNQGPLIVQRRALWLQADNLGISTIVGDVIVGAGTNPC